MKKILDKMNLMELLASVGILGNTFILLVIQNTISYEVQFVKTIEPMQKSSIYTVLQHNSLLEYVYLICGTILICSGIYRLHRFLRSPKDNR